MKTLAVLALAVAALPSLAAAQEEALCAAFKAAKEAVAVKPAIAAKAASAAVKSRDSVSPLYPQLKKCEEADWAKLGVPGPSRGSDGKPETGYLRGPGASLVLLTKTAAYYYHEDCDICAEVTRCDLATGLLSSAVAAHMVDCADMKPFTKDVVFDACAGAR